MAEDKTKKPDELQEEQLDEVAGGSKQQGTVTSGLGGIALSRAID